MRPLQPHRPTPEQLPLVRDEQPGAVLIRGAAGSGKTTTALLRLSYLSAYWLNRREREGFVEPVRVLALTYNRTLEGYIRDLAAQQVPDDPSLDLTVSTVSGWARDVLGFGGTIWDGSSRASRLWSLGRQLGLPREFFLDEIEYILGRFPPAALPTYAAAATRRTGRGGTPRVTAEMRRRLHDEVIVPLTAYKQAESLLDWNDIAVLAAATPPMAGNAYHVVVVDEAQDFSVNQMRAVVTHLEPAHSLTVVIDTAQRIYPQYLSFPEAGVPAFRRTHTLATNYRNTRQIARFARGLITGLTLDEDAALPNDETAQGNGKLPKVVVGPYSQQMTYTIDALTDQIDTREQTAAILTVWGYGAQAYTRRRLLDANIEFIELQKLKHWPANSPNVGLSTLHSAKGLEFDHVFILGLNAEMTGHGDEEDDATLDRLRRLLAMAVGRARMSVTIGYKEQERSDLVEFFVPGTFEREQL